MLITTIQECINEYDASEGDAQEETSKHKSIAMTLRMQTTLLGTRFSGVVACCVTAVKTRKFLLNVVNEAPFLTLTIS